MNVDWLHGKDGGPVCSPNRTRRAPGREAPRRTAACIHPSGFQLLIRCGREFLLAHRLFRSDRTGEIVNPVFCRFAFPPRWHYDIFRALNYFQAVNAPCDPRVAEAIEIVRSGRRKDGRWTLQHSHNGKTYFELERLGAASRWNTLRAPRVLKWWSRAS